MGTKISGRNRKLSFKSNASEITKYNLLRQNYYKQGSKSL